MRKIVILPENVCADQITVEVDDSGVIHDVQFVGGCDGNAKALGRLLKDMPADKAIRLLTGVDCEGKGTSCADQFACGLKKNMTKA